MVASGKVKSVNADNKSFVLTDSANSDFTIKLGDNLVVNRAGKETKSDLKAGDPIYVYYDKGLVHWTAQYILIQEGASKNCTLIHCSVKGYDPAKKTLTITDANKKDSTYAVGDAKVRLNMADSKIEDVTIGDHALLIEDTVEGRAILRSVMVNRAK